MVSFSIIERILDLATQLEMLLTYFYWTERVKKNWMKLTFGALFSGGGWGPRVVKKLDP